MFEFDLVKRGYSFCTVVFLLLYIWVLFRLFSSKGKCSEFTPFWSWENIFFKFFFGCESSLDNLWITRWLQILLGPPRFFYVVEIFAKDLRVLLGSI